MLPKYLAPARDSSCPSQSGIINGNSTFVIVNINQNTTHSYNFNLRQSVHESLLSLNNVEWSHSICPLRKFMFTSNNNMRKKVFIKRFCLLRDEHALVFDTQYIENDRWHVLCSPDVACVLWQSAATCQMISIVIVIEFRFVRTKPKQTEKYPSVWILNITF